MDSQIEAHPEPNVSERTPFEVHAATPNCRGCVGGRITGDGDECIGWGERRDVEGRHLTHFSYFSHLN